MSITQSSSTTKQVGEKATTTKSLSVKRNSHNNEDKTSEKQSELQKLSEAVKGKYPDPTEEDIEYWGYLMTERHVRPIRFTYVDTEDIIAEMVDHILALKDVAIYMDLEGCNLRRDGEICTLQLCVETEKEPHAYLIDVWVLQKAAFSTKGRQNPDASMKSILESHAIPKLFWDCRMDSDALCAQFNIALAAVIDVQLLEVAKRGRHESLRNLRGYGQCVDHDLDLNFWICKEIQETKEYQKKFIPEKGGDWKVLKERPMPLRLQAYCVSDIRYMAQLFRLYSKSLTDKDYSGAGTSPKHKKDVKAFVVEHPSDLINNPPGVWAQKVVAESRKRVLQSWGKGWDRDAPRWKMTVSPWSGA